MPSPIHFSLLPPDNRKLANLCGALDDNLTHIERALTVNIRRRSEQFRVSGDGAPAAVDILKTLYGQADGSVSRQDVQLVIARQVGDAARQVSSPPPAGAMEPRNDNQRRYRETILRNTVTICTGPAGTGKTHIALATALSFLQNRRAHHVGRVVLTRPTVEAGGERIGFLPGDMEQKVNPYLRPLHDILYALLGRQEAERRLAGGDIEVIPMAFMRGLTLSNAAVIVDEAQNTTAVQMKMLLTRLGEHCKMIINGDLSQSDLPSTIDCGLADIVGRLGDIDGVGHHMFSAADVVRHPLVRDILEKYETP